MGVLLLCPSRCVRDLDSRTQTRFRSLNISRVMELPFSTRRELCAALKRTHQLSSCLYTPAMFAWTIVFTAVFHLACNGFDLYEAIEGDEQRTQVWLGLLLGGILIGNLIVAYISSRFLLYRYAYKCPFCKSRINKPHLVRKCRATCCCPNCSQPLVSPDLRSSQ